MMLVERQLIEDINLFLNSFGQCIKTKNCSHCTARSLSSRIQTEIDLHDAVSTDDKILFDDASDEVSLDLSSSSDDLAKALQD